MKNLQSFSRDASVIPSVLFSRQRSPLIQRYKISAYERTASARRFFCELPLRFAGLCAGYRQE
jgi:hypothetical protein